MRAMRRLIVLLLATAPFACAHQPVAEPTAAQRLESTPRHDEWVTIEGGARPLQAYVVYPQTSTKAGAVLVIHENRGLTDWVRSVADRFAEEGYLAIAPDLLSGAAPNGGRTSDFASQDAAREAISKLSREQVATDLANAAKYVRSLPSANGKLAVAGFCWGGSRSWEAANTIDGLSAAFVFYGTGPQGETGVEGIEAPVYGFYGGDDERVNATIDQSKLLMSKAGRSYEPVIYPGAGHAYMRLGEEPDATPANRDARTKSWARMLELIKVIR